MQENFKVKVTYGCKHSLCMECDMKYRPHNRDCHICREHITTAAFTADHQVLLYHFSGELEVLQVDLSQTVAQLIHMVKSNVYFRDVRLIFNGRGMHTLDATLIEAGISQLSSIHVAPRLRGD